MNARALTNSRAMLVNRCIIRNSKKNKSTIFATASLARNITNHLTSHVIKGGDSVRDYNTAAIIPVVTHIKGGDSVRGYNTVAIIPVATHVEGGDSVRGWMFIEHLSQNASKEVKEGDFKMKPPIVRITGGIFADGYMVTSKPLTRDASNEVVPSVVVRLQWYIKRRVWKEKISSVVVLLQQYISRHASYNVIHPRPYSFNTTSPGSHERRYFRI